MARLYPRTYLDRDSARTTRPIPMGYRSQRRLYLAALVLVDLLMLVLAFELAFWVRFDLNLPIFQLDVTPSPAYYQQIAAILTGLWLLFFFLFRAYDWDNLLGGTQEYALIANASAVATATVVASGFLDRDFVIARGWLLLAFLFTFLCVATARLLLRHLVYRLRTRGYFMVPALVVGDNGEAQALTRQLAEWETSGLQIVGVVSDSQPTGELVAGNIRALGHLDELPALVATHQIEELVVAASALSPEKLLEIFRTYGVNSNVRLRLSSGLFEVFTTGLRVQSLGSVPLISLNRVRLSGFEAFLKGCMDRLGALFGLLLLSPLLLIIVLAIKLDSPGPIIYRRRVLGCGGKTFDAFKFRTMYVHGDDLLTVEDRANLQTYQKLKEDPRVTRSGRFLRKYSLDEMPQLVNVLLGQMSLIGPRMITPAELDKYGKWDMNLLTVKPGLSGLWQVSGRSDLTYEERVRLDMHYIRNYTFWFDLHLILRTLTVVIRGKGAY